MPAPQTHAGAPRRTRGWQTTLRVSLWATLQIGFQAAQAAPPQTVYFPSADGTTELVGYLFQPDSPAPRPAVVLLHGRAGPYSASVSAGCRAVARGVASPCDAQHLSQRHQRWGEYWRQHGYVALLVDSFGPRGRGHGYGRHTHGDPDRQAVNELTVRPLDAEGALAWLAAQPGVAADRVMLQGWSNGGSTVLNTAHRQATRTTGGPRFHAALAFYPGCGPQAVLSRHLKTDMPLTLWLAADDDEVSPTACRDLAARATPPLAVRWMDGATHNFDDPSPKVQAVPGNRAATQAAMDAAAGLFDTVR